MDLSNMGQMLGLVGAWSAFQKNHPKFRAFLHAARVKGLREGSVIEISILTPEGEKIETNLRVKAEDLEMIQKLAAMAGKKD